MNWGDTVVLTAFIFIMILVVCWALDKFDS